MPSSRRLALAPWSTTEAILPLELRQAGEHCVARAKVSRTQMVVPPGLHPSTRFVASVEFGFSEDKGIWILGGYGMVEVPAASKET
eukprot:1151607-Pelagomonas_calceolata.AAC.2